MIVIVSLFVETKRMPGTFEAFHYTGTKRTTYWLKTPINFPDIIKALETNKFRDIKTITAEEIAMNNCESWIVLWFNFEHDFIRIAEYQLT